MVQAPGNFKEFFDAYVLEEWALSAAGSSRNLGFEHALPALSPEHWQMVLTSVTARMQMRGTLPSPGWKTALAQHVGRPAN
jgi:hypothetical protein